MKDLVKIVYRYKSLNELDKLREEKKHAVRSKIWSDQLRQSGYPISQEWKFETPKNDDWLKFE